MKIRAVSPSGEVQMIELKESGDLKSQAADDHYEITREGVLKALIPKSWMVEFDAS